MVTKYKIAFLLVGLFFIVMVAILIFLNRFRYDFSEGKTGYSGSISKAKELGVFVSEYKSDNNRIILETEYFVPGEIWLERVWQQGNFENPVKIAEENEYSNYWLYIEIPEKELFKFEKDFGLNNRLALFSSEGTPFWRRRTDNKEFFVVSYKGLPGDKIDIKLLARQDTTDKSFIPTRWPNPILVDTITLIEYK